MFPRNQVEKIARFIDDKVLGVICETGIMVQRLIKNYV